MPTSDPPVFPTGTVPTAEPIAPSTIRSNCPQTLARRTPPQADLQHPEMRRHVRRDVSLAHDVGDFEMAHRVCVSVCLV